MAIDLSISLFQSIDLHELGCTLPEFDANVKKAADPVNTAAALMFLIRQNQRLENRCATYELQVQELEAELERCK